MIHNEKELLELYRSLTGIRRQDIQLCKKFNIHETTLDYFRTLCGKVAEQRPPIKESVKDKVIKLYNQGVPITEIKKRVYGDKMKQGSIYHILKSSGIEVNRAKTYIKIQLMRCIDMRENKKMTFREIGNYFGLTRFAANELYIRARKKYGQKRMENT